MLSSDRPSAKARGPPPFDFDRHRPTNSNIFSGPPLAGFSMPKEHQIMNIINFTPAVRNRHIILDVEYMADVQLYARYVRRDPHPSSLRWPFRRVVSASVMAVSVENGVWEVEEFRSFVDSEERTLVRDLFDWIIERPSYGLTTFSGAAEDLPILKTAAMELGFSLPRQLRHNERDRIGFFHCDLALVLRGGSGQFVHMTELATRLGLPSKMAGSAGQVPHHIARNEPEKCGWISECDVLTCSLLLASHLVTLGQVMSLEAAHYVTMRYVRERAEEKSYHRELGNYLSRVERALLAGRQRWLEAG